MSEEENEEKLQRIIGNLDRDVKLPPYDNKDIKRYSKDYQEYKSDEDDLNEETFYRSLCLKLGGIINIKASEGIRKSLMPSLRLLDWDITPSMVVSTSFVTGMMIFIAWLAFFLINFSLGMIVPMFISVVLGLLTFAVPIYLYYKPKVEAKSKVIRSSGEMIMSILYMVVYMRSSPNLEGAVRFAALNLSGPISKDLKKVLWDVEIGNYSTVSESLHEYTKVWKDFNDDYLRSLQILESAMQDPNAERREDLLQDAIDSILDGTKEKMKHYAQSLTTPVMILNALGAMLPVLGMIMLPLVSVFMGGVISPVLLIFIFNIMLPVTLYWFMQHLLTSRPPTTATTPVSESTLPPKGKFPINIFSKQFYMPAWIIGAIVFLIVSFYGWIGYITFPHFYPVSNPDIVASAPGLFRSSEDSLNPLIMVIRSVSITAGIGLGIGTSKILGNKNRKKAQIDLKKIEAQFPEALFQLGNKISGGTPIEMALEDAAEATKEMEISSLFEKSSWNVKEMGMTFDQALTDPNHGSLRLYPSQLINTVMRAVLRSSKKGTHMAAMAMITMSRYLQNIHQTQETLNDLLEDTTSTITMLAYLLAPVVSGVAVGMSQTIITALFEMSSSFDSVQGSLPNSAAGGSSVGATGILGNVDSAIPPELLQFVVGIYLVQLLYILGTFYMKIVEGENPTYRDMYIGKLLIAGTIFYSFVLILVGYLFGGVVGSIA